MARYAQNAAELMNERIGDEPLEGRTEDGERRESPATPTGREPCGEPKS